jgi:hypothetical protein
MGLCLSVNVNEKENNLNMNSSKGMMCVREMTYCHYRTSHVNSPDIWATPSSALTLLSSMLPLQPSSSFNAATIPFNSPTSLLNPLNTALTPAAITILNIKSDRSNKFQIPGVKQILHELLGAEKLCIPGL